MYYYAYVDESNICTGVYALPSEITADGYIAITEEQYTTQSVVGKHYNSETGEWEDPLVFSCTTDDVDYKGTGVTLTSKLNVMDTTIAGKANEEDLHTHDNKSVLDGITAAKVAAWDSGTGSGTAGENGATFTPSVSADGIISWTNDKGLTNPSPVNIKGADGTNGSDGADGADGADGTTVVVGTTTTGNAGTDATLGSNNYPTIVAGSYVTLNGEKTYAPNIYPRNTGSFDLGAQSNRWSNIYSKTALNVSSDERLKENIKDVNDEKAVDFINGIDVKNFNFIGKDKEEIGIIAQQLIATDPDFAKYFVEQGEDGYYGVKTSDLVFPLIVAVQELKKEIEELKS